MVVLRAETAVRDAGVDAARRRACVIAAASGVALPVYFWVASALVGWPGADSPPLGAPASAYVDFYVDEISRIQRAATVAVTSSAA